MDTLKVLLISGLAAMVIVIISVGSIAWMNPGSRNLALATGTLAAAMLLFVVQLPFELRGSESTDFASVEFTIDRLKPAIRQWQYSTTLGWRIHSETEASKWLAENNPTLFTNDREKVTRDLVVFSLLSYLTSTQYDWQLKQVRFTGRSTGTLTTFQRLSKPHECTTFRESDLRTRLSQTGNAFANAQLMLVAGPLYLPPKTTLAVTSAGLSIQNPFYSISFDIEPSGSVFYVRPGTGGEAPLLPSGEQQFETRVTGIRMRVKQFGLRAQNKNSGLYRDWSSRVVEGARTWFEG